MDLRQLEYLVAVAEEQNFTRAAERVHISQSGISAQIRQLERELGATLIDRSSRRASLTTAGAAALEHARVSLASAHALRQAVDDVTGVIRGRLVVGMVTACTITPLFVALAAFRHAHPGIDIAMFEDNSDRLVERVRSGEADLALVGVAGAPPPSLEALPIVSERLVAAVATDHPLARQRRVSLADVATYPLVCLPQGTGIRTAFDRGCAARGIQPSVELQANAPGTVADLAARGLGVAILSKSTVANQDGRLRTLPIDDLDTPVVLAMVWRPGPSPALQAFLVYGRQSFGEPAA